VRELHDKEQTGREMYTLARRFADDLDYFAVDGPTDATLAQIPLADYYSIIRSIPFRKDVDGVEVVTRPFHLFSSPSRGWDCKKKAIALAAFLHKHRIPFRFLSVSRRPDRQIHHVLVQAMIDGEWCDIDATYPDNELFEKEAWTAEEPLPAAGPGTLSGAPVLISMYGEGPPSPQLAGEYNAKAVEMGLGPATIGGIVAAVIALVGGVTTAIITAVASTRRQEREHEFQMKVLTEQQQAQAEIQQEAIAAQKAAAEPGGITKWILPAGLATAAAAFLLSGETG
jgi:hypothetical protein